MNKQNRARLLMCASMSIFGTIGAFVRYIPLPSGEIALYRALLALLLIGLYLWIRGSGIPMGAIRRALPLLLLSGMAMGINWILLFEAYRYTTVSAATLSYYFAPVIVTVVSPLLFRERLSGRQWICFLMSSLGIVLITGTGTLRGGTDLIGILLGLGAAVFYAAVMLLNKHIRDVDGIHRTFLQFAAAALILIPYVALTGGVHFSRLDTRGWICLLVVGIVHTGIAYCMYFPSIKELSGQQTALLSYVDPLVAVLVSVTLLGEDMTLWQGIGGALILGFTLWNELPEKTK